MPLVVLFGLMFLVTLSRVWLPRGVKVPGKKTLDVKLTLVERLIHQRVNIYCIGAVLGLATVTGSVGNGFQLLVVVVAQAIFMLPLRVRLTSTGIALNNAVYRPWSDFTGFSTGPRRISLTGHEGTRPLHVPMLAGNQQVVLATLRRHLPEIPARKEAGTEYGATVG